MSDYPCSPALPVRRRRRESTSMGLSISPNTLTVLENNGDSGSLLYSNPSSPVGSHMRVAEPPSCGRNFSGGFDVGEDDHGYRLGGGGDGGVGGDDGDDGDEEIAGKNTGAAAG
ncbi:hypothetical protein KEM54_002748, partial [Ascosphaera aggregata]